VYLLKHSDGYIISELYGDYEHTFLDSQRPKSMQFVQKYLRMKHVTVFKLSHDVLQVALDLLSPPPPPPSAFNLRVAARCSVFKT
jgi:hypothetical protein